MGDDLHCLVTDGAFEAHGAEVRFLPAPPPTSERMMEESEPLLLREVRPAGGAEEEA